MTLFFHVAFAVVAIGGFILGLLAALAATAEIRRYGHFHRNLDQNTAIEHQNRQHELEQTLAFIKNELMLELLELEVAEIRADADDFDDESPDTETQAAPVPEDIFDEFDVDVSYAFHLDTDDPIIDEIHEPDPDVIPLFRESP